MAEASSAFNLNPPTNSGSSRKRRRRISAPADSTAEQLGMRWRSDAEQQIYSSKLVEELGRLRHHDSAGAAALAIRDAADRVLAVSAKCRSRWSRAILTGRLSFRLAQTNKKHKRATRPNPGFKKPAPARKLPPLRKKVRTLSRLVPGCRKLPLPSLLEETADYIAALEMQVKAMTFLAGLLNGTVSDGGVVG